MHFNTWHFKRAAGRNDVIRPGVVLDVGLPLKNGGAAVSTDMPDVWCQRIQDVDYAFQPIVNIHTGICYGYEALLRNVGSAGFNTIQEFFDRAHGDGVALPIHRRLFDRARDKFRRLPWSGQMTLFVNMDNRLLSPDTVKCWDPKVLIGGGESVHDKMCIEISERHEIPCSDGIPQKLDAIRGLGLKIAMDDFGMGCSDLRMLYYTRPEFIKIDRFFIESIATDAGKRMLATSIVKIAHLIGSVVVAEGVETPEEYYACRNIGCNLLQGFLVQAPESDLNLLCKEYNGIEKLNNSDQRSSHQREKSLIKSELEYVEAVSHTASLTDILDLFFENRQRTFFIIVGDNDEALGIVREESIKEFAYSRYGRYLLENKTFKWSIDDYVTRIPVIDIHTPVDDILETFSTNDGLEGILICNSRRYVGFLKATSLLKILNEKKLALAQDQNPLSRLPGNTIIFEYISKALNDPEETYILVYFDFDNFKAYNDTYGFRQGDRIILLFAERLKAAAQLPNRFAGHVGGDDFFMGVKGRPLEAVVEDVRAMAEQFRINAESFYDSRALANRYIEAFDRDGKPRRFPLVTVSSVVACLPAKKHRIYTPEEIGRAIAERKKIAKRSSEKIDVVTLGNFRETGGPTPVALEVSGGAA